MKSRCAWVGEDPLMIEYHDTEWGTPVYDDNRLFEFLILEGAQAGLSWSTILKRRESYREAFDNFDPQKVAHYNEEKTDELLSNKGIIRNKMKVKAAIKNAQSFLVVQEEYGSFDTYIWQFMGGAPKKNCWKTIQEIPSTTEESRILSKELKKRGFNFVGPVICYAFMQAVGMVNDHTVNCFRYNEV
ncbi:MAG: DNA-3-methyladenine glycosylase I [Theionarchaea archaeon]|nr:DNA-3-methyladenine glycosylase I [Theionarchaea archaeon]